jgi:hypothetical protein
MTVQTLIAFRSLGVLTRHLESDDPGHSDDTIYVCFTRVKPAKKLPSRRWEINLLRHKAKLLNPVTSNGFHSAYTSSSSSSLKKIRGYYSSARRKYGSQS